MHIDTEENPYLGQNTSSLVYYILEFINIARFKFLFLVSADGMCRLKLNGAGHIKCKNDFKSISCKIICSSRCQGWFTCNSRGKWDRPLPRCVIPSGKPYPQKHYVLSCYKAVLLKKS